MLFQIFAKDWLLTVFIRALHRLEQAMLKVVLQQVTTGQWDTWSRALGRGTGCKAWGGWRQEDPGAAGGQAGMVGGGRTAPCRGHLLPLLRTGHAEGHLREAEKALLVWRTGL